MTASAQTGKSTACEEKQQLLTAYRTAAHRYNVAVEALCLARNGSQKTDYNRMLRTSELARAKSEQARINFEAHVAEHGC